MNRNRLCWVTQFATAESEVAQYRREPVAVLLNKAWRWARSYVIYPIYEGHHTIEKRKYALIQILISKPVQSASAEGILHTVRFITTKRLKLNFTLSIYKNH